MPVLDHGTHPSTVIGPDHRYGCWNLPGQLNHAMSDRCRYDMSLTDQNCEGCTHRGKGEAYDKLIREKGSA